MNISAVKFGEFLMSRAAGREPALNIVANFIPEKTDEVITLDFKNVKLLGPIWLYEVIIGISQKTKNKIEIFHAGNASIVESLKFVDLKNESV